jgi:hypothetical protein
MTMQTIINRKTSTGKTLVVTMSGQGKLSASIDGADVPLSSQNTESLDNYRKIKAPWAAAMVKAFTAAGCVDVLGGKIGLIAEEADLINAAKSGNAELQAKKAAFEAECARLTAAEDEWDKSVAWRTAAHLGVGEGYPERAPSDNTPSHKSDF